ncbi:MAG: hydrogenase expression/formation protein HypE [Verrucomicrobiota bacterium]
MLNRENQNILLAHGGGGKLTQQLLNEILLPPLSNGLLNSLDDSVLLPGTGERLAFTSDSYVVDPLEFPGGDIGKLAVCGTVNDLAMQGSLPRYLSLSLIIEEGFPIARLKRILASLASAADEADVKIVTGDTKVVEYGKAGGLYINTAGIGTVNAESVDVSVTNAQTGDAVIVTGTVGDHGLAVMTAREELALETALKSDVAPLNGLVQGLLEICPAVHCLRDPTRAGLAGALVDIADRSNVGIRISDPAVPITSQVKGACRLLGLDPLTAANEGKAVIVAEEAEADEILAFLHAHPLAEQAARIGTVGEGGRAGQVVAETEIGGTRVISLPSGEQLPRIC